MCWKCHPQGSCYQSIRGHLQTAVQHLYSTPLIVLKENLAFFGLWSSFLRRRLSAQSFYSQYPFSSWGLGITSQLFSCMMSTGVLLCLLLRLNGLVLGEISENFSKCLNFFYNDTPPTGINKPEYKPICQRYRNKYHFASLYDSKRRIPLYSAYILSLADGPRPKNKWMYEPQVWLHVLQDIYIYLFFTLRHY